MTKSFKERMSEVGVKTAKGGSPSAKTPIQIDAAEVQTAIQNAAVAVKFADILMAINYLYAKYPDAPEIRDSPTIIDKLYQDLSQKMVGKEWNLFDTFQWAEHDMIKIISEHLNPTE